TTISTASGSIARSSFAFSFCFSRCLASFLSKSTPGNLFLTGKGSRTFFGASSSGGAHCLQWIHDTKHGRLLLCLCIIWFEKATHDTSYFAAVLSIFHFTNSTEPCS